MKKIIAISVVFALVAGAAFAEIKVAGTVQTRMNIMEATSADGANEDVFIGGSIHVGSLTLSGSNDDNTLSGLIQWKTDNGNVNGFDSPYMAYVWWRPIPQLGIYFGKQGDGLFETAQVVAYPFSQGSYAYVTVENYDYHKSAFGSSFSDFGFAFEIKPIEGLNIVLGSAVPFRMSNQTAITSAWGTANFSTIKDVLTNGIYGQVGYDIPNIGKFNVTYAGGQHDQGWNQDIRPSHLAASFYSGSLVEGLAFELGFGYKFNVEAEAGESSLTVPNIPDPINIGGGVAYTGGDWGVKLRSRVFLGADEDAGEGKMGVVADLLPWYNFGFMEGRLLFRILNAKADKDADAETGILINPYIVKNMAGGTIAIGIMYEYNINDNGINGFAGNKDGKGDEIGTFRIPVSFTINL